MNPDLIAMIVFVLSLIVYVGFRIYISKHDDIEASLIKVMRDIADSLKSGNSLETVVSDLSKRPEYFSKFFKRVLLFAKQGRSFEEALEYAGRRSSSKMFKILCDVLIKSKKSKNASDVLVNFAKSLGQLENQQRELSAKMGSSLTTIKFVTIIILPLIYLFLTGLFGFRLDAAAYVFLFFIAFMVSVVDVILFNDVWESLFFIPLALSAFYLAIIELGPFVVGFVSSFV